MCFSPADLRTRCAHNLVYVFFLEFCGAHTDFLPPGLVKVNGNSATPMKNYQALKSKLSSATPSSTASSQYKPTNSPAACPKLSQNWAASNSLPPTPDSALCDCMYKSLSCVPDDSLEEKDFGDIFGYICGQDPASCAGIKSNTSTGVFGAFSMCNPKEQLGYSLNAYYTAQKKSSDACDFNGAAKVVNAGSSDSTCQKSLSSASAANSVAATATSASGAGSASGSNAAVPVSIKSVFTIGDLAVGLYLVVAMGVGAGMVML